MSENSATSETTEINNEVNKKEDKQIVNETKTEDKLEIVESIEKEETKTDEKEPVTVKEQELEKEPVSKEQELEKKEVSKEQESEKKEVTESKEDEVEKKVIENEVETKENEKVKEESKENDKENEENENIENDDIDDLISGVTKLSIDKEADKKKIIELFRNNVKGKKIDNKKYDGNEGHELEKLMGIKQNSNNSPDIFGYEMKKDSNKISFGDYSASEYLFSIKKDNLNKLNKFEYNMTRDEFIKIFGTEKGQENEIKRYSWSGKCTPQKYNEYSECGQKFKVNENDDLCIMYSYNDDKRENKNEVIPEKFRDNEIVIAIWLKKKIQSNINNKFNNKGFFILIKDKKTKLYDKIGFGLPFNYNFFIQKFKENKIFFDSGMYIGNTRNYSLFRANNNFWHELITEEFS